MDFFFFLAERRQAAFFLTKEGEAVGCCLDKK